MVDINDEIFIIAKYYFKLGLKAICKIREMVRNKIISTPTFQNSFKYVKAQNLTAINNP